MLSILGVYIQNINCWIVWKFYFYFLKSRHTIFQGSCTMLHSHLQCTAAAESLQSDSVRPHRRQPTRLPRPWDSPGKNSGVACHFLLRCMKVKSESEVAQSLSDPMDGSPPGSSIRGIFQAGLISVSPHAYQHLTVCCLTPRIRHCLVVTVSAVLELPVYLSASLCTVQS